MIKAINLNSIVTRVTIVAMLAALVAYAVPVNAAAVTSASDTMTNQTITTAADHSILFTTPTGVAAGETITVTFASDFSVAAALDFEDLDLSIEAAGGDGVCDTGDTEKALAASASGATWGAVRTSATVITFTSGTDTIAAGDEVCIEIGTNAEQGIVGIEQVTNATTSGSKTIDIGGTQTDSGQLAVPITEAGATDQDFVTISATILATLTHDLSSITCALGDMTPGAANISTCSYTSTVTTNATDGYTSTIVGVTDGTNEALNNDAAPTQVFGDSAGSTSGSQTTSSLHGVSTSDTGVTINTDLSTGCTADATIESTVLSTTAQSYATNPAPAAAEATTLCHSAAAGTSSPGTGTYTQTARHIVTGTF